MTDVMAFQECSRIEMDFSLLEITVNFTALLAHSALSIISN